MSSTGKQNRQPAGIPSGGQFAPKSRQDAEVALGEDEIVVGDDDRAILVAVNGNSPDELQPAVDSPNPVVKAVAATNPNLSDSQLASLMSREQPDSVRIAGASQRRLALVPVAAKDPCPFVLAWSRIVAPTPPHASNAVGDSKRIRRLVSGELDVEAVRKRFVQVA